MTGLRLGNRQVEELTQRAAVDFDRFYAQRRRPLSLASDVVVLSYDGKGIVMRPHALRAATARAAARATPKLATRLSRGEKRHRKRMTEVGSVDDPTPVPRTAADILSGADRPPSKRPSAREKWLVASVTADADEVIGQVFDEATRRDPQHRRRWIVLVDGNTHQIERTHAHAHDRHAEVTILIDFVHVLEYVWKAAWCLFTEADPQAENWVTTHGQDILEGHADQVAAAIRRQATRAGLGPTQRAAADTCARYLINKHPYLNYPTALASGWPIATGVIEGACRHLVADRMDRTGARWTLPSAEAVLTLRALHSNGDFDDYWAYHLTQEKHRIHQTRYANEVIPAA